MNVYVATRNPVKLRAVADAFGDWFPRDDVDVHAVDPGGSVPEQPLGEDIARGSLARAAQAVRQPGADVGIGIEAGLLRLPGCDRWLNLQVCAMTDRNGKTAVGLGPGFELPDALRDAALGGTPLRDALRSTSSLDDPQGRGAVHVLSGGRIDREELTVEAVRMALVAMAKRGAWDLGGSPLGSENDED